MSKLRAAVTNSAFHAAYRAALQVTDDHVHAYTIAQAAEQDVAAQWPDEIRPYAEVFAKGLLQTVKAGPDRAQLLRTNQKLLAETARLRRERNDLIQQLAEATGRSLTELNLLTIEAAA